MSLLRNASTEVNRQDDSSLRTVMTRSAASAFFFPRLFSYPFGDTAAAGDPQFCVPKPGIAGMLFPKCFDCLTGFGDDAASGTPFPVGSSIARTSGTSDDSLVTSGQISCLLESSRGGHIALQLDIHNESLAAPIVLCHAF
jgi:hypothetical protein